MNLSFSTGSQRVGKNFPKISKQDSRGTTQLERLIRASDPQLLDQRIDQLLTAATDHQIRAVRKLHGTLAAAQQAPKFRARQALPSCRLKREIKAQRIAKIARLTNHRPDYVNSFEHRGQASSHPDFPPLTKAGQTIGDEVEDLRTPAQTEPRRAPFGLEAETFQLSSRVRLGHGIPREQMAIGGKSGKTNKGIPRPRQGPGCKPWVAHLEQRAHQIERAVQLQFKIRLRSDHAKRRQPPGLRRLQEIQPAVEISKECFN